MIHINNTAARGDDSFYTAARATIPQIRLLGASSHGALTFTVVAW